MTFEEFWAKHKTSVFVNIEYERAFYQSMWNAALQEGTKQERERCLNIAFAYSSVEGIAQTIADEIIEGK